MTKKLLFLGLVLIVSLTTTAQDKNWSVEASYPIIVGSSDIGLSNSLNGVVDIGVKYRFADLGIVKIGAGLHTGILSDSENFDYSMDGGDYIFDSKARQYLIQPKIFTEFNFSEVPRLKPFFGLGYSWAISDYYYNDGRSDSTSNYSTDGGLGLNVGLSFDITKSFFLQVQYDYLRQRNKLEGSDNKLNMDINLIKVGLGISF